MAKITIHNLTLTDTHRRGLAVGTAVVWNSVDGVLRTDVNLYEVLNDLVVSENEVARATALVGSALASVSSALATNQSNTRKFNECRTKLNDIQNKLMSTTAKLVTEINVQDTFMEIVVDAEDELWGQLEFIYKYISAVDLLRLKYFNIISTISEAEIVISGAEQQIYDYQKRMADIEVDIRDLEYSATILAGRVSSLKAKVRPSLADVFLLRGYAYEVLNKLKTIWSDLLKVEATLNNQLALLSDAESETTQIEGLRDRLTELLAKLEARLTKLEDDVYELECNITVLYDQSINLLGRANEVDEYIRNMVTLINGGLIKAGDNIAIEYDGNGFATIHSTIPPFPPRERPKRDCFDTTPIEITYPAPPCPTYPPECPKCPSVPPPDIPKPTTAAPEPEPTTEKPEEKACYMAVCYDSNYKTGSMLFYVLTARTGDVLAEYIYSSLIKGTYPTLAEAKDALSSCGGSYAKGVYKVNSDLFSQRSSQSNKKLPIVNCAMAVVGPTYGAVGRIKEIDKNAEAVYFTSTNNGDDLSKALY